MTRIVVSPKRFPPFISERRESPIIMIFLFFIFLGDGNNSRRLRMARALARLGSKNGIPVLLDLARGGEARKVREEALQALLLAAGRDDKQVVRELSDWWKTSQDSLVWDPAKKAFVPK